MQGYNTQFKKGNGAWNKGLKQEDYLTEEQIDKLKHTQFKKGHVSPRRKELGSERINEFGFIEVKTEQPDTWKLKHRHIWEEEHGEIPRSEEHTSELQSRFDLVCRLLLEKKK